MLAGKLQIRSGQVECMAFVYRMHTLSLNMRRSRTMLCGLDSCPVCLDTQISILIQAVSRTPDHFAKL